MKMNDTAWIVVGTVVVAIVAILVMGKRFGLFEFTLFGKSGFKANATHNERKASADHAKAGRDIKLKSEGNASAEGAKAGRDIDITVTNVTENQ